MKKRILIPAMVVLSLLAGIRTCGTFIPYGASPIPFLFARVQGPILTSPNASRTLTVYFNDAGAAHSGNHWTWVVENHWLFGSRMVTEGYLGGEIAVSGDPVPHTWSDGNQIEVRYLISRYGRDVIENSSGSGNK